MNFNHQKIVAVNVAAGPTITLASGRIFDFLNPESCKFTIEDIAHGLANVCRYAGQCKSFYSVAEHSLLVSDCSQIYKYEALLHDAAEAFIGDVTRPLKQLLPEYKRIERIVEDAIMNRFDFNEAGKKYIKSIDLQVLAAEQMQIMPPGTAEWAFSSGVKPAEIEVNYLDPVTVKERFLEEYEKLKSER